MKLYSNEIVFRGHPDKVADQISDAILDEYLKQDPYTRAGIETVGGKKKIFITGEVTTKANVNVIEIARKVLIDVGYSNNYEIIDNIGKQSPDIAQGVDVGGAGDNGMMFGYACDTTNVLLPKAQVILQELSRKYDNLRKLNNDFLPDGKAQITGYYDDEFNLIKIKTFTICYQNTETNREETDQIIKNIALDICEKHNVEVEEFLINPTGKFLIGGFDGDAGLCLSGDTLLYTKSGLRKIKELKKGLSVYTETGEAKITEYYKNGMKDTRIITDKRGTDIEATLNHPFRVWSGNNLVWKECGLLEVGDFLVKKRITMLNGHDNYIRGRIVYTKHGREIELKLNKDLAYILGWLVGDGNLTSDDRAVFYYGNEEEREHLYTELCKVFPEEEIKWYAYQDDRYSILSKDLVKVLVKAFGVSPETQPNREVPKAILRGGDINKRAFLSGLFDSDGCIQMEQGRDSEHISVVLTTSSKVLSQQVGVMLHSLGMQYTIYTSETEGHIKETDNTYIVGGTRYDLSVNGLASIREFLTNVGFRLRTKKEKYGSTELPRKWLYNDFREYPIYEPLRKLLLLDTYKYNKYFENYVNTESCNSNRKYKINNIDNILDMYSEYKGTDEYKYVKYIVDNFDFVEIGSITNGKAETYDITLDDETHSFIANGFLVHNTGRKIVVDSYQSFANVGGGCFSGKDSTKVDRSGAYKARQIAKRYLQQYKLKWCEVQLSFAIGKDKPLAIYIDSNIGNIEPDESLYQECTPRNIIQDLDLRKPIYKDTAMFGHFGLEKFSWEKL